MSNIHNTTQPFYALCSLPFSFPSRISSLACLDLNDTEYSCGKMTGDERSKEGKDMEPSSCPYAQNVSTSSLEPEIKCKLLQGTREKGDSHMLDG